jgi:galactokinase
VIEEHFAGLGMTADEAASRARLIDRVTRGFSEVVGAPPEWRWFVPGRIEVFGKHTDYAGGRSLLVAVPRGFAVAARSRSDRRVRVADVLDGARTEVDLGAGAPGVDGWASYVHVVARRLAANFAGAPLGADIAILSDLPRAAGLSSSSALVVGVAVALARRGQLAERREWLDAIRTTEDLAWYLGCVENGLDYPGLPGTAGVGTHGGSEDHTAILACRTGALSQYRFVPVQHLGDVPMPAAWTFVVGTSGVQADKGGSVRDQYNRASLMTRALVELWNAHAATPAGSLGAAVMTTDAAARFGEIVTSRPSGPFSATDLLRRLAHFMAEDALVPLAAQAFARQPDPGNPRAGSPGARHRRLCGKRLRRRFRRQRVGPGPGRGRRSIRPGVAGRLRAAVPGAYAGGVVCRPARSGADRSAVTALPARKAGIQCRGRVSGRPTTRTAA